MPKPRAKLSILALVAVALIGSGPHPARAQTSPKTVYVDASTGNDSNDCLALNRACRTIQKGASVTRGGDAMIVGPGVYYEKPVFQSLGSSSTSPVWIRAEPRGGVTISGMWKEVASGQVTWDDAADGVTGDGIFSAIHDPCLFGAYQGKYLFRLNNVADLRAGKAGTVNMVAYGMASGNGRVYIKLPGGVNPNGASVLLSSPTYGDAGSGSVVKVSGSPYVIFDGFRIKGAGVYCISFSQDSVSPTLRNMVFSYCRYGAQLPDNSIVEWSEYVWPGFRDFSEAVRQLNGGSLKTYTLVKEYNAVLWLEGGIAEAYQSYSSRNEEFRYNYLHEAFDGEILGEFEYSQSHHNVYLYNYDDHIQMESTAGFQSRDLRLHDNLFLAAGNSSVSHQEGSLIGPHYRNVMYGYDELGWNAWTIIKSDAPNATQKIYYYHNLMWGRGNELFWNEKRRDMFQFRNNIFVFESNRNSQDTSTSFDSDYNLLVNGVDKGWLRGSHGAYLGTGTSSLKFVDVGALNFAILAGSAAENRGVPLPGFNDGAPGGPDVGPFEVGFSPGAAWPRPRVTVFTTTVPERWNGSGGVDIQPPAPVQNLRRGDTH
ncbi:MAG TPA: hypothetical protein VGR67_16375 [Candidatus Polarisedimenticolia bacterium]|jgi:hypothetical protein|nr:hypothetical protein [Candidatus Polarisedimenticolia bacterium]